MDDEALVANALHEDADAFGPIVARYKDAVFAVALARVGSFHDAEDVAQEAFVEAFECLGRLRNPCRLGPWLRSITIHRAISFLRRKKGEVNLDAIDEPVDPSHGPEGDMEQVELRDRVLAAISRLGRRERETAVLYYLDEYSQKEVANILEVPLGTVKRRLHVARRNLKQEMESVVKAVLRHGAPREDFAQRVFGILNRYGRPAIPWQRWDEIADELRSIGTQGIDGFIKALESPHSPTRALAAGMLEASGDTEKIVEGLLKKSLGDPSKRVRKTAFLALFGIMERDEAKREELVPCLLPLLTDRSKVLRRDVAWYLCFVEGYARYVPLEVVARALVEERDPSVQRWTVPLMGAVLRAQEAE